jgi:hypothetical protein
LNDRHLRRYRTAKKIASMRAPTWYQFNKREAERNKQRRLSEIRAAFERAYNDLLAELAALSDGDLKAMFPTSWSKNSTRRTRLATILRSDVSGHFRDSS